MDGSGLFLKKCWPIIGSNLYHLAAYYLEGILNLKYIGGSFITLVTNELYLEDKNLSYHLTHLCMFDISHQTSYQ
jgi:hypothetical protein